MPHIPATGGRDYIKSAEASGLRLTAEEKGLLLGKSPSGGPMTAQDEARRNKVIAEVKAAAPRSRPRPR